MSVAGLYPDDEIKSLATKYRGGDSRAAEVLLDIYTVLIGSYLALLKLGRLNPAISNHKHLCSIFGGGNVLKGLWVLKAICRKIDYMDMKQELILLFLETVIRWKDRPDVEFNTYINACYKWAVKYRIEVLSKDVLFQTSLVPYKPERETHSEGHRRGQVPLNYPPPLAYGRVYYVEDYIDSITMLTNREKEALKTVVNSNTPVKGMCPVKEVAGKMGISQARTAQLLKDARDKILKSPYAEDLLVAMRE